jgi:DNA-binding response OmpR family regulator
MQVLVVEDDRDLRRFLCKALREEGYGAVEAESGDQALDRALDARYTCIILDVMLPGRDGFDVVTELRSRGVFTPVLMLTGGIEVTAGGTQRESERRPVPGAFRSFIRTGVW